MSGQTTKRDGFAFLRESRDMDLKAKGTHFGQLGHGVVEWIERSLLMLEVRGSNPGHSI